MTLDQPKEWNGGHVALPCLSYRVVYGSCISVDMHKEGGGGRRREGMRASNNRELERVNNWQDQQVSQLECWCRQSHTN